MQLIAFRMDFGASCRGQEAEDFEAQDIKGMSGRKYTRTYMLR